MFIKMNRYFMFLFLLASCCGFAQEKSTCQEILSFIQAELPREGILKSSDGFVYIDLDDDYIHQLVQFIQKEGFEEPPYFEEPYGVGAHLTVIYPAEVINYGISDVQECGERIEFIPTGCQIVRPLRMEGIDQVYFVVVYAPRLDQIRAKYGLPKREYDFHITIGVKKK